MQVQSCKVEIQVKVENSLLPFSQPPFRTFLTLSCRSRTCADPSLQLNISVLNG